MAKTYTLKTAPKEFIDKVVNATEGKPGGGVLLNAFFKIEQKKRESSTKQNTSTKTKKNNTKKFASIGIKQMRAGRSAGIITSGGLLTNNKTTIKKKTLLGS